MEFIQYQLPDGRIVNIAFDVCRSRSWVTYQLADGRVVDAVICPGQR